MVGGLGDMLSQLIKANVVPALMEHLKETDTCPNCGDLLPRTAKNGPCSCGNFQPAAPNEFVLTWEIAGKPPPTVSCICGREFADEAAFGVHVCNDKPGSAEELIPDEEQEAAEARRKSIGSAWSK